jgi:hypothetical protein
MPITLNDKLLTLPDIAKLIPSRRRGRPCSNATVWRWAMTGLRGVKLETICVGCQMMSTTKALEEFFRKLGEVRTGCVGPVQTQERECHNELQAIGI